MIVLLHLIISTLLTVIYAVNVVDFSNWLLVLSIVPLYLVINVFTVILIVSIFFVIVFITKKLDPRTVWKHNVYMAFANYLFYNVFRVKVIVKGIDNLPKNPNFVVYANHIEYGDPLYIKKYFKDTSLTFVAKEPLFRYPLIRDILESTAAIPIGKSADRSSLQSILTAIKQVKHGQPVALFPEGKRSYSNDMNPFKPGAFKVVSKAKADMSLVVLYDFHKINQKPIRFRKVKVYLSILPLIKYDEIKDMDTVQISQMAFEKINDELNYYKKLDLK